MVALRNAIFAAGRLVLPFLFGGWPCRPDVCARLVRQDTVGVCGRRRRAVVQNFVATVVDAQLVPEGPAREDWSRTTQGLFLQVGPLPPATPFPSPYLFLTLTQAPSPLVSVLFRLPSLPIYPQGSAPSPCPIHAFSSALSLFRVPGSPLNPTTPYPSWTSMMI
jgi:hypothetical protein